jgi:hypothetical protein
MKIRIENAAVPYDRRCFLINEIVKKMKRRSNFKTDTLIFSHLSSTSCSQDMNSRPLYLNCNYLQEVLK